MPETGVDELGGGPQSTEHLADKVAKQLGVEGFIAQHLRTIIAPKLESSADTAVTAPVNDDMMFFALSLPIMNGIIHLASNKADLDKALALVKEAWKPTGDADLTSTISALMLIHVVWKGWQELAADSSPETRRKWQKMLEWVKRLSQDMKPAGSS